MILSCRGPFVPVGLWLPATKNTHVSVYSRSGRGKRMDASIGARHSCTLYAPLCQRKSSCLKKGDRQSRSSNLDMYVRRELASCAKMECAVKPKKQTLQQTAEKAQNNFRLCLTPGGICESAQSLKELFTSAPAMRSGGTRPISVSHLSKKQ
jgi:hypothetical protein